MKNIFLFLFLTQFSFGSTNNLPQVTSSVILKDHVNQPRTALSGVLVPRNSSGTVSDVSADLGSSTFRWNNLYAKTFKIQNDTGGAQISISMPAAISAYSITLPTGLPGTTLPLSISSAGVMSSGQILTAQITDLNVTTAKIADVNVTTAKIADANVTTAKIADANVTPAKLSAHVDNTSVSTGTCSTGVTSFIQCLQNNSSPSIQTSITTHGRPIHMRLQSVSGSASPCYLNGDATNGSAFAFFVDGSLTGSVIATGNGHPGGGLSFSVPASAASHTIGLYVKTIVSGTAQVQDCVIWAEEE